jgi:hypothetical protein
MTSPFLVTKRDVMPTQHPRFVFPKKSIYEGESGEVQSPHAAAS